MEDIINTMKSVLVKHSLLVCVLWLLTCCTGVASENYRRIMWVSTTGEDSPQCIHDTPTSDPVPHPRQLNESCGSLNYALAHIGNDTLIVIGCGIHVLEPVGSLLDGTPLMNVTTIAIRGDCESSRAWIQCTDRANLAFYNSEKVMIKNLAFQDCGEQLQYSNSLSDSSTLYFQDCKRIIIYATLINITGPYGRGASFVRYDTSITHGNVVMVLVRINHFGIHGSGIHFEILTSKTRDNSTAREKLHLKYIYVYGPNAHPSYNVTTTFELTGINITVMGDGEGGEITLSHVGVKKLTRGNSISVALHDTVHAYNVIFSDIASVIEDGENYKHLSNIAMSAANISTTYSSIQIQLKDNSNRNYIQIGSVDLIQGKAAPGSVFSIEVTDQSEENVVQIQETGLFGANRSEVHRRGLQVIITGWARRNEIQATGVLSSLHRAYLGAGAYIEFSVHAMGNSVVIRNSSLVNNYAHRGGGIAVVCRDFANQNIFKALDNQLINGSFAELGGGVYLSLQDSSSNDTIQFSNITLVNNTAHCGGGMFIQFKDTTAANTVEILLSILVSNTLFPSEKYDMMGGGVHVDFSTDSAVLRTNNTVSVSGCAFIYNTAGQGVGGGISVLYRHPHYQLEGNSGDSAIVDNIQLVFNKTASGSACAFQSLPTHEKRLFTGVRMTNVKLLTSNNWTIADHASWNPTALLSQSLMLIQKHLAQTIIPSFQVETNTNLIFAKSVQITASAIQAICGASSQGIYALDSVIVFQANTSALFGLCVATHGGAIALYGESHIRVSRDTTLTFTVNHAFQRGGAIYVDSATGVVPVSNCFLQYDQDWDKNRNAVTFQFHGNTAKYEGLSVYTSDIRDCISRTTLKSTAANLAMDPAEYDISSLFMRKVNFTFIFYAGNDIFHEYSTIDKPFFSLNRSHFSSREYRQSIVHREIVSGPNYIGGATTDISKPVTMHFIPGKQKTLPYTHVYDVFGSKISSVFTVLINKMDSLPVELNSFSKYTADFTVILHGIPQRHGMANHSFPSNARNKSAVVRPPQLVLQSLDNTDLLLVMNIKLQCCSPGYIFRYGSGDMGTCHCGVPSVNGIADCDESHPEKIGAVLKRDHWAGYLPSNDQHSCDGQKFFTGQCPPGYCQTQPITLPVNNSQQELQDTVCTGTKRKGLLCGDCLDRNSIAVNFNGIRPVCVSCEDGLSKVGILVWILSEWMPMLTFMFVLMLFNIDLVSGRFNSFLLFAQLLAFSTIRGDADLGPVHNAFIRIYRFLYGMWNLDFFGVLLPPYCLTPHAHLTLLQTILLHCSIGLFPLSVAITLIVLERSAEKWICCHRVDQCLRRMRRWKAKYSDGMSYDRALPAFVILGFTRFLVSSSYILVSHTLTGEDGERKVVVWWQGSVHYGSIQHIAYFIPAIVILLVFVLLPSFLLLTLPIGPQLFGRLIIAVPPLKKLQKIQTFCSNVYTDRWVYHFVNVFQGCYKERFRSLSSFYFFHRIVHLLVAVFIPRAQDALHIQIFLTVAMLLLIAALQPYNSHKFNTLDAAILGNLALILILSLHITDLNTPIGTRQFYASLQMILIYLPILYPGILLGRKVYLKCRQLRCCQKQEEQREDNAEPLLEAPAERLGNLVLITELRA